MFFLPIFDNNAFADNFDGGVSSAEGQSAVYLVASGGHNCRFVANENGDIAPSSVGAVFSVVEGLGPFDFSFGKGDFGDENQVAPSYGN